MEISLGGHESVHSRPEYRAKRQRCQVQLAAAAGLVAEAACSCFLCLAF